MRKIRIGIHKRYYGYATAVYQNCSSFVKYISVPFIPFRKLKIKSEFLGNIKFFSPLPRVDLFHTYNNIVVNHQPWIISFESFLPRFFNGYLENRNVMGWGLNKLASNDCKAILPISKAAKKLFYSLAAKNGFDPEIFKNKIQTTYPGIQIPKNKIERKDNKIKLIFIGNDFFRKGGRVVVDSFLDLQKNYDNLELIIISSLSYGDYITRATYEDQQIYLSKIKKNRKISLLQKISQHEILTKYIPQSDINILPTFDDTFGYVIAEGMLAGLATISTNVFAVPEMIEHNNNGYLIDLPIDGFGMIKSFREKDLSKKKKWIINQEEEMRSKLKRYLIRLIEEKNIREKFGKLSQKIANKRFTYKKRNEKFSDIYNILFRQINSNRVSTKDR